MVPAQTQLELEIRVSTPHRQPVSFAGVRMSGTSADVAATGIAPGIYRLCLPDVGDYSLVVEQSRSPASFDHRPLRIRLRYSRSEGATVLATSEAKAQAQVRIEEAPESGDIQVISITLDYIWFSPIGYPPTLGNRVDMFVNGEDAWRAVVDALERARERIHITTFIYHPTAELLRPAPLSDPEERARFTVHHILQARAQCPVVVRLLIWKSPFTWLPRPLRSVARIVGDHFEVLQEANPTRWPQWRTRWRFMKYLYSLRIGSYHQKMITLDGCIGFCGGMNLSERDWDARRHRVFDPRRCSFSRSASFRKRVAEGARRPDYPPRHDLMARLEGPSVPHLEENFRERWNRLIGQGVDYSKYTTPVDSAGPCAPAGPSQVQVVRTMPAPAAEQGILDVYLRAIAAARQLIYIEDPFFRSTLITEALIEALRANPSLAVVVITTRATVNQLFAAGWARACFECIRRERPGFELYSLRVHDVDSRGRKVLEDVDSHAKLLLVDDVFLTVGSCNINNRGFKFEGELDLAIVDPELVAGMRAELWRGYLGGDARVKGDIASDVAVWKEHAERNRRYDPASADGPPASLVFPFEPKQRWRLFGPDVF